MYFLTKCQFLSWRTVLLNFHFHLIFFLNYRTFLFYLLLLQINILTTFTFLLNALSKQIFFLRELSKQFSTLYCTLDAAFLLSGGIYCTVYSLCGRGPASVHCTAPSSTHERSPIQVIYCRLHLRGLLLIFCVSNGVTWARIFYSSFNRNFCMPYIVILKRATEQRATGAIRSWA